MTFNQIKYFIKLAECLNFTEAARCLFISQPALSRQISVMEEELGTPLFVRDKKRLQLTPGGILLYNRLPQVLQLYHDAVDDAHSANQGYEGALHIGILDVYDISDFFADLLKDFQSAHPAVRLDLKRFSLVELPRKLYDGALDLIVTYNFSLFDKPDLLTIPIQSYDSCIMLNREHPLAGKKDLSLSDLKGETFVQLGPEASEEGFRYVENLCARCGFHPALRKVEKMEDVLLWVQTGNGVAITSSRSVEAYNPHVVIRPIDLPDARSHEIFLAWHKTNYNPAIALFSELTEQKIAAQRSCS
ncbi:MAG: LysR family transcriptional regulator [Eubacterium sp.]|jgi:DNA-binding transcriptional LysR family regulator